MSNLVAVRPAQQIPQHVIGTDTISTDRRHRVRLRHPAYSEGKNVLLVLLAPDHPSGGIHHETARIACAVIAGNRWDGYFTETIDGPRIIAEPDCVLLKPDYFFNVPEAAAANPPSSQPYRYPVIPSFDEWRFPHENLPPSWMDQSEADTLPSKSSERSNLSVAINLRDGSCRMSDHEEGCEIAHLCPRSEDCWFHANKMQRYIHDVRRSGLGAINDISNVMLLRSDLHTAFDQAKLVFVPKRSLAAGDSFVTHLLASSTELRRLYHNTKLHPITGISHEFLLARFAWSIFPLLEGFLHDGVPRELLSVSLGEYKKPYLASAEECKLFTKHTKLRSRSTSPKKRTRSEAEKEGNERVYSISGSDKRIRMHESLPSTGDMDSMFECSSLESFLPSVPSITAECSDRQTPQYLDKLIQSHGNDYGALVDETSILQLRKKYLESERNKSDPQGTWLTERRWMLEALERPLSPLSIRRYLEGMGAETHF